MSHLSRLLTNSNELNGHSVPLSTEFIPQFLDFRLQLFIRGCQRLTLFFVRSCRVFCCLSHCVCNTPTPLILTSRLLVENQCIIQGLQRWCFTLCVNIRRKLIGSMHDVNKECFSALCCTSVTCGFCCVWMLIG